MSLAILYKLLAIFLTVALGWIAGRARWLGHDDPARVLANAAFYVFVPALLFRTTARIDFTAMPWSTLAAFFAPVLALLVAVYAWQRLRSGASAAAPAVRAIAASFGNTIQIGVPMTLAVYGEAGLGVHMMIVSVHALTLLTVATTLVELDLAREHARQPDAAAASLLQTLGATARNTVIHPVVLPVLAGMAWNLAGLPLPGVLDEVLQLLASAVVPLCLVLIGMSLAYYGLRGNVRGALLLSALKLLVLPALVLVVARYGFGLGGAALGAVVMIGALPAGANALLFSQRYRAQESEVTTMVVLSTFLYAATAPLWLLVLRAVGGATTIAPP
jgi:malonate transporter